MELIHGGDVVGYEKKYGRPPLDYSASLNPMGMPPAVARAAKEAVDKAVAYPDPLCRDLTAALAVHLAVEPGQVLCGGGSADIIYRLVAARRPKTALLPAPTFAEYERALLAVGCEVERYFLPRESAFAPEESVLDKIRPGLDILFWCQPNNPTGQLTSPELLQALLLRCKETGTLLFLDECFVDFVPGGERYSLIKDMPQNPHLFILGSFTKLYAMAGIRAGYGLCADSTLLAGMRAQGQPWGMGTVAQAAALAALEQREYVRSSLALIEEQKQRMKEEFAGLGIPVLGAAANYLFFYVDAPSLMRDMAEDGVLIRDCRNFAGLGPGYYRVAVRTAAENDRLFAAMAKALRKGEE